MASAPELQQHVACLAVEIRDHIVVKGLESPFSALERVRQGRSGAVGDEIGREGLEVFVTSVLLLRPPGTSTPSCEW